jgi:hypothetical protein
MPQIGEAVDLHNLTVPYVHNSRLRVAYKASCLFRALVRPSLKATSAQKGRTYPPFIR